jgi:hypothetical protein
MFPNDETMIGADTVTSRSRSAAVVLGAPAVAVT